MMMSSQFEYVCARILCTVRKSVCDRRYVGITMLTLGRLLNSSLVRAGGATIQSSSISPPFLKFKRASTDQPAVAIGSIMSAAAQRVSRKLSPTLSVELDFVVVGI